MLTYFLIGAAIGALTGVPIGPVNVAVIDTAYRYTLRRAVAVALGGAVGDGIYAAFGLIGVGPWLDDNPSVKPILFAISGVVLLVYGVVTARSKPIPIAPPSPHPHPESGERASKQHVAVEPPTSEIWRGFCLGFLLIVANPAALITWVVIVGSALAVETTMQGVGATIGVASGSLAWFTLVAYLANHGKKVLGGKAVWITRIVGYLLLAYGTYLLGRAAYAWFW